MLIFFGFIPTIQAKTPYADIPKWQNIGWPMLWDNDGEPGIAASEVSFFRCGYVQSIEDKENDWFPAPPYDIRLYINGIEIGLKRLTNWVGVPIFQFYAIFEPGYFKPGEKVYTINFQVWVLKPYQADGLTEWRIYEDYGCVYEEVFNEHPEWFAGIKPGEEYKPINDFTYTLEFE